MMTFLLSGELAEDYDVFRAGSDVTIRSMERIRLDKSKAVEQQCVVVCRQSNMLITSCYLATSIDSPRLLVNQSYRDAGYWFPDMRPKISEASFTLQSDDPLVVNGPHVVIGGPIDGVWYHWLTNWCTRLVLFKMLRPDLFEDPNVRFVIDSRAAAEPFKAILQAWDIAEERLMIWDQQQDLLLEDAVLVSFPDERYLYPALVSGLVQQVKEHFLQPPRDNWLFTQIGGHELVEKPNPRRRRIFASRQAFTAARRRVANFAEIEPVLAEFGFEVVLLGQCSAFEQVEMFAAAEFVLGVHGSDLTNIIFCPLDASVLVVENERNILNGLSASLDVLATIVGVKYTAIVVDEAIDPNADYSHFPTLHHRDVIIPPEQLRVALLDIGCYPVEV